MERKFSGEHDPEKLNPLENNFSNPDIHESNTGINPDHILNDISKSDAEFKDPDKTSTGKIVQDETEGISDKPIDPEIRHTLRWNFEDIDQFISGLCLEDKDDKVKEDNDQEEERVVPEFVEKFLNVLEDKIAKCAVINEKGKCEDDTNILNSINRVSKLATRLDNLRSRPNRNYVTLLNRVRSIQQLAMSYLEDEFKMLLEKTNNDDMEMESDAHCDSGDSKKTNEKETNLNHKTNCLRYSQVVLTSMNKIAKAMIEGGFESECCQCYIIGRRQIFDKCQKKNDFECISIDEIQKMRWESLEREIPSWIKTFKDCATVYFWRERRLAEAVFLDYPSISSSLFSNLTRGVVIQLLNFAEGVATTERSAEKLFKFLDMYETLRDGISTMDGLFPEECENEVKNEMLSVRSRLGEAAIYIFRDLEDSIKSDTGRAAVPGGAVHPLTRYTINYLKYACEYRGTLEQVFRKHSKIEPVDSNTRLNFDGSKAQNNDNDVQEKKLSPFGNQLTRLMDILDTNLQDKSRLYKDIELSCIFMMNNGRYMLQKVKGSAEIYEVMGNTWCRKMSSELRNYHKSYQRDTWNKILGCLGHEGLQVNGKVQKTVLKERFKSFNMMFDEIHKTQSTWIVSDEQLQSELRVSITAIVIPAYRSFLGRFSQYLDSGKKSDKCIKYQPEDIETMIDELFDGNPTGMARRNNNKSI